MTGIQNDIYMYSKGKEAIFQGTKIQEWNDKMKMAWCEKRNSYHHWTTCWHIPYADFLVPSFEEKGQ